MTSRLLTFAGGAAASWSWQTLRDRLVTSARFRRWATAFPLTRPIANRRAKALFDLCAGFVYSQILLACVRLHVFQILAEGPQTVAVLAGRFALPIDKTLLLLEAAASLGLVERRAKETFGLGPLGAAMVDNAGIAAMVEHHTLLYSDLADPLNLLRGGQGDTALKRYWAYCGTDDPAALASQQVDDYSALMAASQSMIASEVLAAWPMKQHRCLMDIGGGDGMFLSAVAAQAPRLQMILFDLPSVVARAKLRFTANGLADRVRVVGGSFHTDLLPQDADAVSLIRVIHDHDDDAALAILRAARRALPQGGTLLLAEPMAGVAGAESIADAYFGFYLLAMGRGRPRDVKTLFDLVEKAGFERPRHVPTRTPMLTSLIVAHAIKGGESVDLC
jgi:demethylspheroidene O-methyltransferase